MNHAAHEETWLVTGGAGFIGANFVLAARGQRDAAIVNLDRLTYAGNLQNLAALADDPQHLFVRGDIADRELVGGLLGEHRIRAVVHFAAESHVDRSIYGPQAFVETNVLGTFQLLEAVRRYWEGLPGADQEEFRFLQVSTDEVYGSLMPMEPPFCETTPYAPNSPYAASKAASDHLVRAYHHTYGLPTLITNCSNNYGPCQFPEKLIPLMILNAVQGAPLPIYGDGLNVRDWLYVADHCEAIGQVLARGRVGETYNIGGNCEKTNLEVVKTLCAVLDELLPGSPHRPHEGLLTFVKDRPGHDRRYAMDIGKISRELGWGPRESFESGLSKTVRWYLENPEWVKSVQSGEYRQWLELQYGRA
jgi:dTDP-glucose 4,6-dehydratase